MKLNYLLYAVDLLKACDESDNPVIIKKIEILLGKKLKLAKGEELSYGYICTDTNCLREGVGVYSSIQAKYSKLKENKPLIDLCNDENHPIYQTPYYE